MHMSLHQSEARRSCYYSVVLHVNIAGRLFQAGNIHVCAFSHLMFSAVINCEVIVVFRCKLDNVLL